MGKEVTRVGQYALKRTLGKGAFGWVKLGVQDKTGLKVAIKVRFAFAFLVGLDCDWDWIRSRDDDDVRRSTFDGSRAPVETTTTDGRMDG